MLLEKRVRCEKARCEEQRERLRAQSQHRTQHQRSVPVMREEKKK